MYPFLIEGGGWSERERGTEKRGKREREEKGGEEKERERGERKREGGSRRKVREVKRELEGCACIE